MCYVTVTIKDNLVERYPIHGEFSDFSTTGNYLEITYDQIMKIIKDASLHVSENPTLIVENSCYG